MILDQRQVTTLARRGLVALQMPPGTWIDCYRGRIWITEDGGVTDFVLEAGDRFEAPRSGHILVQALVEAVFSVRVSVVQRRVLETREGWLVRAFRFAWRGVA